MTLCADWVTIAEVEECGVDTSVFPPGLVSASITAASEWMYEQTGRRWSGECETIERPCGCSCGCLISIAEYQSAVTTGWPIIDCGCTNSLCSCTTAHIVETTYGPINSATVTIDGAAFTDFEIVAPNRLLRTDGDAWPSCQDYRAGQGFAVTYRHGETPPELAKLAAAALASEVIRSCANQDCALPAGTTSVNRRGVNIQLDPEQAGKSLARVAMALSAYPKQAGMPDVRVPGRRGLVTSGPQTP